MTSKRQAQPTGYFIVGTVALFLVGFLLLVIFGARIYRDTVAIQQGNMDTRALLSYLVTTVRDNDTRGAVSVEDGVLVVRDGESGYAFRIFLLDGQLIESFAATNAPLDPTAGQIIGETKTFIARKDGAYLSIETDAGSVLICLRSEGGAA